MWAFSFLLRDGHKSRPSFSGSGSVSGLRYLSVFCLIIFLAVACFSGGVFAQNVEISTAEQLKSIGTIENLSGHHTLKNDISLSGIQWTPIGNLTNPFNGTLNGNGYNITDFSISSSTLSVVGLFGYVDGTNSTSGGAKIHNLTLNASTVSTINATANVMAGALVASLGNWSTVENITVKVAGTVSASSTNQTDITNSTAAAGGMIGSIVDPAVDAARIVRVNNCYVEAEKVFAVSDFGKAYAGGVAGDIVAGIQTGANTLTRCGFAGNVNATGHMVGDRADILLQKTPVRAGGIVGATAMGNVSYCYSSGTVEALIDGGAGSNPLGFAGGIVGISDTAAVMYSNSSSTIKSVVTSNGAHHNAYAGGIAAESGGLILACSATGAVTANAVDYSIAGGIAGKSEGPIQNSYATGLVNASSTQRHAHTGGIIGYMDNVGTTVDTCYVTSAVEAHSNLSQEIRSLAYVGGLAAYLDPDHMYYDLNTTNTTQTGSPVNDTLVGGDMDLYNNSGSLPSAGVTFIKNSIAHNDRITISGGYTYAGGIFSGKGHRMNYQDMPSSVTIQINGENITKTQINGTASDIAVYPNGNWTPFVNAGFWQENSGSNFPILKDQYRPAWGTYGNKGLRSSYEITITENGAGTGVVTADKTMASAGETVTLTALPNANYGLSSYTVKTNPGDQAITVVGGTFIMPASNVTVSGMFNETVNITVTVSNQAQGEITSAYNATGQITCLSPDSYNLTVFKGDDVLFNIVPFRGFTTQSFGINGTVQNTRNTSYTFENIQDNASINATFISAPTGTPSVPQNITPSFTNPGTGVSGVVITLNESDASGALITVTETGVPGTNYGSLSGSLKPVFVLEISSNMQPQSSQAWVSVNITKAAIPDPKSVRVFHNMKVYSGGTAAWQQIEVAGLTFMDTGSEYQFRFLTPSFSYFTFTIPAPDTYSSSGNTENAFRVLFDARGGSFVQPSTGLSYGDRIAEPAVPVKDGYTFGGWYKNEACTIQWIFKEDAIPGDMTLYAKWTSSDAAPVATSSATAAATAVSTAVPTTSQSSAATTQTTSSATTAASISPTMTQASVPLFGILAGVFVAACILTRRRD